MSRFQAWTLGSRTRYALAWGATNAAILCAVVVLVRFPEVDAESALPYVLVGFPLNVVVQALIGYPLAMRKHSTRHG